MPFQLRGRVHRESRRAAADSCKMHRQATNQNCTVWTVVPHLHVIAIPITSCRRPLS